MIPQTISNFNLIFDGVGFVGLIEEMNLPKLVRKVEEYRNGGMFAPAELDLGMEALEADFTVTGYNKEIIKKYGVQAVDGVLCRLLAAETPDSGGATDAIEIVMRGRWRELELGTVKTGEKNTTKVTFPMTYFKYSENGEDLIEIDTVNMIFKVAGKDLLESTRKALSIA